MDITFTQLSLFAQNIVSQLQALVVALFDSFEVALFLFLARLFTGVDTLFMQ